MQPGGTLMVKGVVRTQLYGFPTQQQEKMHAHVLVLRVPLHPSPKSALLLNCEAAILPGTLWTLSWRNTVLSTACR
jgi:hypothetical protein